MFIFLHGPDTFRSRRKLGEITSAYYKKYGSGLTEVVFDARVRSFADFTSEIGKRSLFAPKRLVIVERMTESKDFLGALVAHPSKKQIAGHPDIFVVFWDEKDLKSLKKAASLLRLSAHTQGFEVLGPAAFLSWSNRFAKSCGVSSSGEALALLAEWAAGDSWYMAQEIRKLHAYKKGATLTLQDVQLLSAPTTSAHIFTTVDFLYNGDKTRGMAALQDHLRAGEAPLYLLHMLARQLRIFALVKSAEEQSTQPQSLSGVSGLHPFVVRKSLPLARRISWQGVKQLFEALHETDRAIKKGALDPRLGLELFALCIASNVAPYAGHWNQRS